MARINQLNSITSIQSTDIFIIDDLTETQTGTIQQLTNYMEANLSIPTGIGDITGLQAALDGKADEGHTHVIQDVSGLQVELDRKYDSSNARIVGQTIFLGNDSIIIPSSLGGVNDDRIPSTAIVGQFLRFAATNGQVEGRSIEDTRRDILVNNVDNVSDADKPVSTATQNALDLKLDATRVLTDVPAGALFTDTPTNLSNMASPTEVTIISGTGANTTLIGATSGQAGLMTNVDKSKLDAIEVSADVTDTANVYAAIGINQATGSNTMVLTQTGSFIENLPSHSHPVSQITGFDAAVDTALGVSSSGSVTEYLNRRGQWTTIMSTGTGTSALPSITDDGVNVQIDPSIRVNVDAAFRVQGCIDLFVPQTQATVPADGTALGTTTSTGNDAGDEHIFTTTDESTNVSEGDIIAFPDFAGVEPKIVTSIAGTLLLFSDQPLEETVNSAQVNIVPTTVIATDATLPVSVSAGVDTIVFNGDLTASLSQGDNVFVFRTGLASRFIFGTISEPTYDSVEDTTTIVWDNATLSGTIFGANISAQDVTIGTLTGATTTTLPAVQVATIERDLTEFHSQNIELDVTSVTNNLESGSIRLVGTKTGTLASPPTGMVANEIWLDTTDSTDHPVIRLSTGTT